MKFEESLIKGRLIKRYKRFLADIKLSNGKIVTAHCPNPGSMLNLVSKGCEVWVSKKNNVKSKLLYSWELVKIKKNFVGINTLLTNKIAIEAIKNKRIEELSKHKFIRKEVSINKSTRIDILMELRGKPCYIEVKNVTLNRKKLVAEFPDSITKRGTKHLKELSALAERGVSAIMLYIVQRSDCKFFKIAHDIDSEYAENLIQAQKKGVKILCYNCSVSQYAISVNKKIDFIV